MYAGYRANARIMRKWDPRNPGNVLIRQELEAEILALLLRRNIRISEAMFLDVGCGAAQALSWLAQQGAREESLYGVDLRRDQIREAQRRHPRMPLLCGDARRLPFRAGAFDVVLCNVLFSSILHWTAAQAAAAELTRVLKPTGIIIWCDNRYPNPWNPHVRGYSDRDIRALFPESRVRLRSVTLVPGLARRLGRLAPTLYPLLARVPMLRIKYLGTIEPGDGVSP